MTCAKKLKGEVSVGVILRVLFHFTFPSAAQAIGLRVQKENHFKYFTDVCR